MILDVLNEFCDATAANTGVAGSYLLGNQIDLGPNQRSPGGDDIYLVINVATTFTSGGAATVAFSLASDAQAAIAVDGSQTEHFRTKAFALADLVAGRTLAVVQLPMEGTGTAYERYLGIVQTTAVAALTAGAIDAFLTRDPSRWKAYDAPWQL